MKNLTGLYKHQRDHTRSGGGRKAKERRLMNGERCPHCLLYPKNAPHLCDGGAMLRSQDRDK